MVKAVFCPTSLKPKGILSSTAWNLKLSVSFIVVVHHLDFSLPRALALGGKIILLWRAISVITLLPGRELFWILFNNEIRERRWLDASVS